MPTTTGHTSSAALVTNRHRLVLAVGLVIVLIAALQPVGPDAARAGENAVTSVIASRSAQQVSLDLSRATFDDGSATEVLLGRADQFADSLGAGALGAGRPLLLAKSKVLDDGIVEEMRRLGATSVTVLGGEAAISADVVDELGALGLTVQRLNGPTRLETAVAVAGRATSTTAILARAFPAAGADDSQAFADSLAAGAWAAASGNPVLLTQTDVLSGSTASQITDAGYTEVIIVGGTAAISDDVADAVRALGPTVTRVSGASRFATATAIAAARGFNGAADVTDFVLVDGQSPTAWWSGFAVAAHAADTNAPVVLAAGDTLPQATVDWISGAQADRPNMLCLATPAACDAANQLLGEAAEEPPTVRVRVDPNLSSSHMLIGEDGDVVELGIVEGSGIATEVALERLIILADGPTALALAEALGGTARLRAPLPDTIGSFPLDLAGAPAWVPDFPETMTPDGLYTIRGIVAPDMLVAADLAGMFKAANPYVGGDLAFSSQALVEDVGTAMQLQAMGFPAIPDVVVGNDALGPGPDFTPMGLPPQSAVVDRSVTESPTSTGITNYDANPWTWDWLDGDVTDFGVPDVWRTLVMLYGVAPPALELAVLDAGFPADPELLAAGFDPRPNPDTPWHGFKVATVAGGQIDNQRGGAGVTGGLMDLAFGSSSAVGEITDFETAVTGLADLLASMVRAIDTADAVNISSSLQIDEVFGAALNVVINPITASLALGGVTIFASAGNSDDAPAGYVLDVDAIGGCFIDLCWEGLRTIPCESSDVVCIGGTTPNTFSRDPGSWWGDQDVDHWAPFTVYQGPRIADATTPMISDGVAPISGTSFSSPFVASTYLLIRSVQPGTISRAVALDIMARTAAPLEPDVGGPFRGRVIQPFDAVMMAIGMVASDATASEVMAEPALIDHAPEVDWTSPVDNAGVTNELVLTVDVTDPLDAAADVGAIQWDVNGEIVGTTPEVRVPAEDLGVGFNEVTLTVETELYTYKRRRTVFTNEPLTATITSPVQDSSWSTTQSIGLEATIGGRAESLVWTVDDLTFTGASASIDPGALPAGVHDVVLTATNSDGFEVIDERRFVVFEPAGDAPPSVQVLSPDSGTYVAEQSDENGLYNAFTLTATGDDPEDGNLSGSIVWTGSGSDFDGDGTIDTGFPLGTGSTLTDVRAYLECFDVQDITFTASVTDSADQTTQLGRAVEGRTFC